MRCFFSAAVLVIASLFSTIVSAGELNVLPGRFCAYTAPHALAETYPVQFSCADCGAQTCYGHLLSSLNSVDFKGDVSPAVFYNRQDAAFSGFDMGMFHKYAGYATLAAALVTGVTKSSHSIHCDFAKATTALAGVTVLSGWYQYGMPTLAKSRFVSDINMHKILGFAGMLGCAASVYLAEDHEISSHGGIGVAGAGCMALSVVLIAF